jgi:hypothetical protein
METLPIKEVYQEKKRQELVLLRAYFEDAHVTMQEVRAELEGLKAVLGFILIFGTTYVILNLFF